MGQPSSRNNTAGNISCAVLNMYPYAYFMAVYTRLADCACLGSRYQQGSVAPAAALHNHARLVVLIVLVSWSTMILVPVQF